MIRLILFILLVGFPIAEIAVFLAVGSVIGALPTIAIIILTAIIGASLLKRQGVSVLRRLKTDLDNNKVPAAALGEAVTVAVAGILLLTPGFITDTMGFALFMPGVRRWLGRRITGGVRFERGAGFPRQGGTEWQRPQGRAGANRTIDLDEGEYSRSDPESPWSDRPGR